MEQIESLALMQLLGNLERAAVPEVVTNPKCSRDATEPGFDAAGWHVGKVQICDFAMPANQPLDGGAIVGFVAEDPGVEVLGDLDRPVPTHAGLGAVFGIARVSQDQQARRWRDEVFIE